MWAARQLQPADPVEHRELLGDHPMVAVVALLGPAARLGARPAVADPDRPGDLLGHAADRGSRRRSSSRASALTRRMSAKTSADVALSSSPVGSSASRTAGLLARATAIATRCCSPPDRASGRCDSRPSRPTSASRSWARASPAAAAVEDHRQLDVLERAQVGQEVPRRLLPDHPDHPTPVGGPLAATHLGQVVPGDQGPSGRRSVEPAEDVQQGRLAAARGADDRHHLAPLDEQVETLEGDHLEVGDLEDPDEVVADDQGAFAVPRLGSWAPARSPDLGSRWSSRRPAPAAFTLRPRSRARPARLTIATTAPTTGPTSARVDRERNLERRADDRPESESGPERHECRQPEGDPQDQGQHDRRTVLHDRQPDGAPAAEAERSKVCGFTGAGRSGQGQRRRERDRRIGARDHEGDDDPDGDRIDDRGPARSSACCDRTAIPVRGASVAIAARIPATASSGARRNAPVVRKLAPLTSVVRTPRSATTKGSPTGTVGNEAATSAATNGIRLPPTVRVNGSPVLIPSTTPDGRNDGRHGFGRRREQGRRQVAIGRCVQDDVRGSRRRRARGTRSRRRPRRPARRPRPGRGRSTPGRAWASKSWGSRPRPSTIRIGAPTACQGRPRRRPRGGRGWPSENAPTDAVAMRTRRIGAALPAGSSVAGPGPGRDPAEPATAAIPRTGSANRRSATSPAASPAGPGRPR